MLHRHLYANSRIAFLRISYRDIPVNALLKIRQDTTVSIPITILNSSVSTSCLTLKQQTSPARHDFCSFCIPIFHRDRNSLVSHRDLSCRMNNADCLGGEEIHSEKCEQGRSWTAYHNLVLLKVSMVLERSFESAAKLTGRLVPVHGWWTRTRDVVDTIRGKQKVSRFRVWDIDLRTCIWVKLIPEVPELTRLLGSSFSRLL